MKFTTRHRWLTAVVLAALGAAFLVRRAQRRPHPCDLPEDLPVPRERVVQCAERYIEDQWYTAHWGKFAALDADPYGHGTWYELFRARRNTLRDQLDALCTHPRDKAGALGHTALFEPARPGGPCVVFSITPLLGISVKDQACQSVREQSACMTRDVAIAR